MVRGWLELDLRREARTRELIYIAMHGAGQRFNAGGYVLRLILQQVDKCSLYYLKSSEYTTFESRNWISYNIS